MALSKEVSNTLSEASGLIRHAMWLMAKNERPATLVSLVKVLSDLEKLVEFDVILDDIDNVMDNYGKPTDNDHN